MVGMLVATAIDHATVEVSRQEVRVWREANWDLIRRTEASLTAAADSLSACYEVAPTPKGLRH